MQPIRDDGILRQGGEEFGGRVGLVMVVSGMFGSIVGGIVLDKTHKFK